MRRLLVVLAAALLLSGCSSDTFGFSERDFPVLAEADTHRGFQGDGAYYRILDCSQNAQAARALVDGWAALPLPESLELLLYGGERDGVYYGYEFAETAHIPAITHGYYRFLDRHSAAKDPSSDEALFSRASMNFSLALYDSDTERLYYFAYDS